MMNLRHLKLWKRSGSDVTSRRHHGNDDEDVIVVRAPSAAVDYDIRSPSSDSGYSDVVPASLMTSTTTTTAAAAGFGARHLQCQRNQQTIHEQQLHQHRIIRTAGANRNLLPVHEVTDPSGGIGPASRRSQPLGAQGKRAMTSDALDTVLSSNAGSSAERKNPTRSAATGVFANTPPAKVRSASAGPGGGNRKVTSDGVRPKRVPVAMETFIGLIRDKNVERLRQVLADTKFDVNSTDSVGRTLLHHAVLQATIDKTNDLVIIKTLIQRGADVNIKDETNGRETALHIALRKRHLAAVEMLLESPGFDVFKCGSLQRHRMLPELCLLDDMYQPPVPHLCRQPADAPTSQNGRQQLRVNGDGQQAGFRHRSRDSDDTAVKSRSFGDQFILSCRQWNTFRRLVDLDLWPRFRRDADCEPVPVSDLVLIRDDRLPALGDVIRRLEAGTLARLYVVGCQLRDMESADWRLQLGRCMALRSLVLSHAQLRRIPDCVFDMSNLEVLIVDNNHLIDVPSTISRLSKLTTFVCDTQRPRLRRLPTASLARLQQLKVLSFSDNAFEAVEWTAVLCNLRVLRFSRNRVTRLPVQLVTLRQLTWLDVSYNPIGQIPHQLLELFTGPTLVRFDYRGLVHLRPPSVRGHVSELISHLRVESILASTCVDDVVSGEDLSCDVTLALYGETGSGKSTLMRALKDQRGVCRDVASASSSRQAKIRPHQQLEIDRFVLDVGELLCTSPSSSSPSHRINHDRNCTGGDGLRSNQLPSRRPLARRCNVTTFAFSGDYCDAYTRQLRPDIRLLLVDMTSLEQTGMGNVSSSSVGGFGLHTAGSHGRTATRTRIWLEALRELEPEVPVILVGTHADLVRSTSGFDALIDELFTPEVRLRHRLAMKSSTICSNCLLCETGSVDSGDFDDRKTRQRAPSVSSVWPPALFKSRSSPVAVGRFDEMSIHFVNNDDHQHRQHQMPFNGHVTALTPDEVSISSPLPQPKSTYASERNRKYPSSASLSSLQVNSGPIFPHIVGCAVVDSVRNFPKSESKKSNVSVERLRGLIGRLAVAGGVACRVPSRWSALAKHLDTLGANCGLATTPCIPVDDVICLARSYDVDSTEVPVLLHWLHRRARVVCFSDFSTNRSRDFLSQSRDENILYRYVAVDASWFANQLTKIAADVALTHGARLVDGYRAVRSALFADLGVVDLRDGGKAPNTVASWLLSAAERLGILVRLGTAFSSAAGEASCSALHFLPDLLENGFPNRDAWPDRPEAVERQVTCDLVGLRVNEATASTGCCSRFRLFAELLEALYSQPEVVSDGAKRRPLDVVFEPHPVVLATETVFYSALDTDGCLDCRQFRLSQRRNRVRSPHRMAGNSSEDDLFLDLEDFDFDNNDGVSDDVLHKLRISFDPEGPSNPFVRIQVRGPSPCCVMQAVIEFVEKYLDEPPMSKLPTATSGDDVDDSDFRFQSTRATDGDETTEAAATVSTLTPTDGMSCNGNAMAGGTGNGSDELLPGSESLAGSAVDITAVDDYPPPPDDASFEGTLLTPHIDEYDNSRMNFLLCAKCVLLGETSPERIPYSFARDALETLPSATQSGDRNARRCARPVCSRWHNLGSWRRALMGDYRFGSFGGPGGSGAGGLGGIERPVYSLAPTTLPDYEHPRLLLLLPPSATEAERAWRTCGRARFLEGHDLHVLCENPTAWHMMDGRGLRLPSHLPSDPARKAEFSLRMLTVLDLSLTIVQLVQGANEHQQTCRLLSAVIVELLRTYDFLKAGAVSIGHNSLPGPTTSTPTARSAELPRRTESELRREAELYLCSNRDRIATFLTRSLTSAAQHSAAADSSQQADIYLKAGGSASPEDIFGRGSGTSGPIGKASRTELGRFLRMETSPGRFGSLRSIYVGGELRWVCEKHYVELRSMPTIQLRL